MDPMDNLFGAFTRTLYEAVTDAGQAPAVDTPAGDTPAGDATGQDPAASGEPDPSAGTPDPQTPPAADAEDNVFRIGDVPEEYRADVERLQKQMQATLSRARAEDRDKFAGISPERLELVRRLNDPGQAEEALEELAEELGYEPVDGTSEPEAQKDIPEDQLTAEQKELRRLAEAERSRVERENVEKQERITARLREHVSAGIEPLRDDQGQVDPDRERLVTFASLSSPGADGFPDVESAVALLESVEAKAVSRFIAEQKGKQPAPDPTGGTGVSQVDTSTPAGRAAAATKIAARHLGGE